MLTPLVNVSASSECTSVPATLRTSSSSPSNIECDVLARAIRLFLFRFYSAEHSMKLNASSLDKELRSDNSNFFPVLAKNIRFTLSSAFDYQIERIRPGYTL